MSKCVHLQNQAAWLPPATGTHEESAHCSINSRLSALTGSDALESQTGVYPIPVWDLLHVEWMFCPGAAVFQSPSLPRHVNPLEFLRIATKMVRCLETKFYQKWLKLLCLEKRRQKGRHDSSPGVSEGLPCRRKGLLSEIAESRTRMMG